MSDVSSELSSEGSWTSSPNINYGIGIQDLSTEVLEIILDFLGDIYSIEKRAKALMPLMLVCKKWKVPAHRMMLKKVTLGRLDKLQKFLHHLIQHDETRYHVSDAEIFTSTAEVPQDHRDLASSPMIATITACANLVYIKIGGVNTVFADSLKSALKGCPKLTHFAYRNMTNLYRFSWISLIDLVKDLQALRILQFTGALEESSEPLPRGRILPPSLRGIHLTHTRTSDADLGQFLSLSSSSWTFMALSRITPGQTYHGLLNNLRKHAHSLVQLHLSEPLSLIDPLNIRAGGTSGRGGNLILDQIIELCTNLSHLHVRGPHCSNHLFQRLPDSIVTIDLAGCPALRPEWITSTLVGKDFPELKLFKVGLREMDWPPDSDAAVMEACEFKGISFYPKP